MLGRAACVRLERRRRPGRAAARKPLVLRAPAARGLRVCGQRPERGANIPALSTGSSSVRWITPPWSPTPTPGASGIPPARPPPRTWSCRAISRAGSRPHLQRREHLLEQPPRPAGGSRCCPSLGIQLAQATLHLDRHAHAGPSKPAEGPLPYPSLELEAAGRFLRRALAFAAGRALAGRAAGSSGPTARSSKSWPANSSSRT
jgi:hypothetical protein